MRTGYIAIRFFEVSLQGFKTGQANRFILLNS
jgi:hypothetical protein